MAEVRFVPTPGSPSAKLAHRVYSREFWNEDWQLEPYLWCDELSLSVFPTMPTASLVWWYGDIRQPLTSAFARFVRNELIRVFVKVEYDTEYDEIVEFTGVVEIDNDRIGGTRISSVPGTSGPVATGDEYFTAYGMEWLLVNFQIMQGVVSSGVGPAGGAEQTTDTPPVFNADGLPNKTIGQFSFSNDPDAAEFWSSRSIVRYLLKHQTPKDAGGSLQIPFALQGSDVPDWDRPELAQYGSTTYELISQILNPRRGIMGYLVIDDNGDGGECQVRTDTFTDVAIDIPLPDADDLPANHKQLHLIYDTDPQTTSTIKTSAVELFDQVVYRGERRRSVGTFAVELDGTLQPGWTPAEETRYQLGGSTSPSYPAAWLKERRKQNEFVRGDSSLAGVFNYFRIPKTWDRLIADGEGGAKNPMFPVNAGGGIGPTSDFVYFPSMRVEQTLPLLEGVDYSGAKVANGTLTVPADKQAELPPLAWMQVFGTTEWRLVTEIAKNADLELTFTSREFNRWSGAIRIPHYSAGIHIDVHSAPKHVLDALNFPYLAEDEKLGGWDYRYGLMCTLSIPDDRYCEGRWPATIASGASYVQVKLIRADGFRKDYVAPGTVVGTDIDGIPQRSTGGFIPKVAPDDDEHKLIAAAKIAAIYYTQVHHILSLSTYRLQPPSRIELGSLVTKVGDPALLAPLVINTPVTEIRISSPMGETDNSEAAKMDITTWAGELDPLLIAPLEPGEDGETEVSSPVVASIGQSGATQ